MQSSHSHDVGMKKSVRFKNRKVCQKSLLCNLFCLSHFMLLSLSFSIPMHCNFCIFLCNSIILVALLLSVSISGCQVFEVTGTNQAQPWCNYCHSDWGGGDSRKEHGKLSALQPLRPDTFRERQEGVLERQEQVRQKIESESTAVN